MPSPPIQPDPKEAVEAQLCAYLEGELSPAERADIDRHLAVNPQHRTLLADLARQRDWLRAVPAEPAPAEIGEPFHQQVERSLLLGEGEPPPPGRLTGRGFQVGLIAALVLVAAGLGAVMVVVLAGPSRTHDRLAATMPPPATEPAAIDDDATRGHDEVAPPAIARPPAVVRTAAPLAVNLPPATPAPMLSSPPGAADAPTLPPGGPRTLHLRVTTADPAGLGRFLTRSGLAVVTDPVQQQPDRDKDLAPRGSGGVAAQMANSQAELADPAAGTTARAGGRQQPLQPAKAAAVAPPRVPQRYVVQGLTPAAAAKFAADLTAAAAPGRVVTLDDGPATQAAPATRPAGRTTVVVDVQPTTR